MRGILLKGNMSKITEWIVYTNETFQIEIEIHNDHLYLRSFEMVGGNKKYEKELSAPVIFVKKLIKVLEKHEN